MCNWTAKVFNYWEHCFVTAQTTNKNFVTVKKNFNSHKKQKACNDRSMYLGCYEMISEALIDVLDFSSFKTFIALSTITAGQWNKVYLVKKPCLFAMSSASIKQFTKLSDYVINLSKIALSEFCCTVLNCHLLT